MGNQVVIDKVSNDRRDAAQQWEGGYWVAAQRARARYGKNYIWRALSLVGLGSRHRGDDWNHWWKKAFDDYSFLPPRVDDAIEVGCGPYTNVHQLTAAFFAGE